MTKSNLDQVPPYYVRKQTLANCERFITDELKKLEDTILSANERITTLEYNLFEELREKIAQNIGRIQSTVRAISVVDCIGSLAETAVKNNYVMPQINLSDKIVIKDGRHPVVESTQRAVMFVPNDTTLDRGDNRLAIITGPNMAGKSTYMRWRRSAALCRRPPRRSAWWIRFLPASARPTISPPAGVPLW